MTDSANEAVPILRADYEALVEALKTARHQVNLFARPDDAIAQAVLQAIDTALAKVATP